MVSLTKKEFHVAGNHNPYGFKRRSCEPVLEIDNETAYRAETALMSSDLCGLYSPDRPEVEKFIQHIFRQAYGANVRNFMPKYCV